MAIPLRKRLARMNNGDGGFQDGFSIGRGEGALRAKGKADKFKDKEQDKGLALMGESLPTHAHVRGFVAGFNFGWDAYRKAMAAKKPKKKPKAA